MKKDFPFTTYDFYAYLATGLVFLFSIDLTLNSGLLFLHQHWNFVEIAFVISISYILGQIVAIPSSLILEHFLFSKIFSQPMDIQLGIKSPALHEKVLSVLIGRYYEPFPVGMREKILSKASGMLDKSEDEIIKDAQNVFQPAFSYARKNEDVRVRLDDFRNQYGFARNITFVGLTITLLFWYQGLASSWALFFLVITTLSMFIRFAKFYASFQAEVLRTFAFSKEEKV